MIHEYDGNLLTCGAQIVCQQVNCMGVMGAGLALSIRKQFPGIYAPYKKVAKDIRAGRRHVGEVFYYSAGPFIIANIFSQYECGRGERFTNYDAVALGFANVHQEARVHHAWRVAIPHSFGCGLAGGEWSVVKRIILEEFSQSDVNCDIVRLIL